MIQKGFSLVELLVVVAIIGVLAGVGIVGYDRYVENTRTKVLIQNYHTVKRAVEFEFTVANNGLSSAIKEFNENGQMVDANGNVTTNSGSQKTIDADTTCNNFVHSVKEHFKHFKNPWNQSWESITIDTQPMDKHRQGQIQLACNNQQGVWGQGAGCPIGAPSVRAAMVLYLKHHGRFYDDSAPHDCDGTFTWGNDETAGDSRSDCVWREFVGGPKEADDATAKVKCGWSQAEHGNWIVNGVNIPSSAGGACSNSYGKECL